MVQATHPVTHAQQHNTNLRQVALNIRTIPYYLRRKLKVMAAEQDKTMDELVIGLIEDAIYRHERN